jgi:hypothetical protein
LEIESILKHPKQVRKKEVVLETMSLLAVTFSLSKRRTEKDPRSGDTVAG